MAFVILFCFFTEYGSGAGLSYSEGDYGMVQDVNIMIFVGFGFLFNLLPRYGWSAVSITMLVGSMCFEWFLIVNNWIAVGADKTVIGLPDIAGGIFAACSILIAVAGVLGRVSLQQLVIMLLIGVPMYCTNMWLTYSKVGATDTGGTIVIHAFGAFFGFGASWILGHNKDAAMKRRHNEDANYNTNLLAMIGTLFLWCYYPSFNGYGATWCDGADALGAACADSNPRFRATFNTQIALMAAAVTSIIMSDFSSHTKKNKMIHMQTGVLAGGVTMGCLCDMDINPWGAILLGTVGAITCVLGIYFVTPFMEKKLKVHDTCDCMALHGIPAFISVFASCIALKSNACPTNVGGGLFRPGSCDNDQVKKQIGAIFMTAGIGAASGAVTGCFMSMFSRDDHWYDSSSHFDQINH